MANQCSLTAQIVLVVNKKKQNDKKQTKKNQKKKKMGIKVPTMNHYPWNGQEGDPEFSTK